MPDNGTDTGGSALQNFPLFDEYFSMVQTEIEGLSDEQLDWVSDKWGWSGWSIRNNISHVASHLFRWYLFRWGDQLFPAGIPFKDEVQQMAGLPHRRLDEDLWWEIEKILRKLDQALEMMRDILSKETLYTINEKTIEVEESAAATYSRLADENLGTLMQHPEDPSVWIMTLEGNLHHSQGEMVTHLYNVQRLKLAQGLTKIVTLPKIGYWDLPDWDRSEP
ncbi:hypothetical protein FIM12_05600 [SAR202 cluster bacterium AD-804-J14_MRT_500m]|nr:hypothetical protein [SAR202 cluster bacterium AD-804-J14_MRT_500m]